MQDGVKMGTMKELFHRLKEAIEFYIEEIESISAYDAAKASGDEVISFEQAISEIGKIC